MRKTRKAKPKKSPPQNGSGLTPPLYHQVYSVLRNRVMAGDYQKDAPIPGEHELARDFDVSRVTVRKALDVLEREGLIRRVHGSGTFANPMPSFEPYANLSGFRDMSDWIMRSTRIRMLDFAYVEPPPDVRKALGLAEGALTQHSVRVRSIQGTPIFHLTAYVPEEIGRAWSRTDMRITPLTKLLRRAGIVFSAVEQTITAVLAQPREAQALGVAIGSPLLSINWIMADQKRRPVYHSVCLARPDMYHLHTSLRDNEVDDHHPLNMLRSHGPGGQPR
ncbi:MAG: GntR family transcriptional regulator [Reyranellaceae bacterium]